MSAHRTVAVALGPRRYDILIGPGLLDRAGALLRPLLRAPRVVVVTDSSVGPLYAPRLAAALARADIAADEVVVPAGEASKSFAALERLVDKLLALRLERGAALIALGGGMIGDLTGLAASIVLRGIDFVQAPTTLLAQVDSSVGGKTAINSRHGKNLIGTFHQPRLVIADTTTLDTLPARERRAGYAEVVKYGLIADQPFFTWLERNGPAVIAGDEAARLTAVARSCEMKAAIVVEDEREEGRRALLNLGHTFAHAMEATLGYGDALLHGEAVAGGLALAFALSVRLGLCPPGDSARVAAHLASVGLPFGLPPRADAKAWSPAGLIDLMGLDKKVKGGRPTFVLARGIGGAFTTRDVPEAVLKDFLSEAAQPAGAGRGQQSITEQPAHEA